MPVEPTPKQRARRSRAGPYDEPGEEEVLVPESGVMNLSTFFGPQPSETQGSKRPTETPEALKSNKRQPASGPAPWPAPPTRPAAREEEETLVPQSGIMQLSYPSSSSSSSSGPPPPPEKPRPAALTPQPADEEELLQPIDGVMELALPPTISRNLSVGNQRVW
jgi:hypothetical protein